MAPRFTAGVVLLLCCAGCSSLHRPNLPWRTKDPATGSSANPDRRACPTPTTETARISLDQLADREVRDAIRCSSDEHYGDLNTPTTFDLYVVEFDDQGRFWNRAQADRALENIRAARENGDVLVVTFFHGWFNNGDVCNGKLSCFRELMSLIAEVEVSDYRRRLERLKFNQESRPRKVIGIFGAWRGETLAVEGAKFVTFWGRKAAAHTVGENGAVTEFVSSIFRIVHRLPIGAGGGSPEAAGGFSSSIVIGHSFGAALLMSAIGTELNRAAGEALASHDGQPVTVHNRMADLVVLINPAVEASRFDNLREAASTATFSTNQVPVFLTLSSDADNPNKILFPIGQAVAFAQKAARSREQWQGMIQSLGTFRANHTHHLIPRQSAPSSEVRVANCQCQAAIADYRDVLLAKLLEQVDSPTPVTTPAVASPQNQSDSRRVYLYSRLEPMRDTDPKNPFFMVHVDRRIIGGHSDIFNPRTVDFLIEFIVNSEAARASVLRGRPQPVPDAVTPPPSAQPPGLATSCFAVEHSPDGPVSVVKLDEALPREARLVRIEHVGSLASRGSSRTERFLDNDERQFAFAFTQQAGAYVISALDSTTPPCLPLRHPVAKLRESSPTRGSVLIGLADGLGAQLGGTFQKSRFVIEASVIKKAGTSGSELTSDLGIGYRGNRSILGAGHRWRHDFDLDAVTRRNVYTHYTLELPGVRFLNQTWSSWMGIEFTPVEWERERDSWHWDPSFAVRFQIRLPRERWLQ